MGALDVCPFIPVSNATMVDCVKCSKEFGQLLAESINVPVYLYEYSSIFEHRKSLPQIRAGEYEGLNDKVSIMVKCMCILLFRYVNQNGSQIMVQLTLYHLGVLLLLVPGSS